jgi:hypothetical protein
VELHTERHDAGLLLSGASAHDMILEPLPGRRAGDPPLPCAMAVMAMARIRTRCVVCSVKCRVAGYKTRPADVELKVRTRVGKKGLSTRRKDATAQPFSNGKVIEKLQNSRNSFTAARRAGRSMRELRLQDHACASRDPRPTATSQSEICIHTRKVVYAGVRDDE